MSESTGDLLDELDELEDLEILETNLSDDKGVPEPSSKNPTVESKTSSANEIDAAYISLDAAKASQEAATENQKAAEATINIAHNLKAQIIDLSEANSSWRQATRNANVELKSARSAMTTTMSIMVVLSLISTSLTGWVFYKISQENQRAAETIIDIIQTENSLFNQGINSKIDQISSLIGFLVRDMQQLAQQSGSFNMQTPSLELLLDQETLVDKNVDKNILSPKDKIFYSEQNDDLSILVTQILDKQQQLQASLLSHSNKIYKALAVEQTPSKQNLSGLAGLTDKQIKQLDGISWLVRKQERTLKSIQESLKSADKKQDSDELTDIKQLLNELKSQIDGLSMQQRRIKSQVNSLQEDTEQLLAEPKPYSFRLRQ